MSGDALTVWQPYADLIDAGTKRYETRVWAPPARLVGTGVRVILHSSVRRPARGLRVGPWTVQYASGQPVLTGPGGVRRPMLLGAVLGTFTIGRVLPIVDEAALGAVHPAVVVQGDSELRLTSPDGALTGPVIDAERPVGHYQPGGYAWQIDDYRPIRDLCHACDGGPCVICGGSRTVTRTVLAVGKQRLWTYHPEAVEEDL